MTTADYLDRLLLKYSNTFNIYQPYRIGAKEYAAYGYFFSHNEKYILVQEANMWTMDSFEHMLFLETEEVNGSILDEAADLISGYMEEQLVRKGEKYPEQSHMSSILTVVILSRKPLKGDVQKRISRYHFDKGYKFHMRGFCRGRIIAASMDDRQVYACAQAKDMKPILLKTFEDVEAGKEGFRSVCERQGVKPFQQQY